MINIWDYFMRRKSLLAVILAVFFGSSILSYHLMYGSAREVSSTTPSYITIEQWGQPESEIEIPRTGNPEEPPFFSVITPQQVIDLAVPDPNKGNFSADTAHEEVLQPENLVTMPTSTPTNHTEIKTNLFCDFLLIIMSLAVLVLGGYLTYQHFMR